MMRQVLQQDIQLTTCSARSAKLHSALKESQSLSSSAVLHMRHAASMQCMANASKACQALVNTGRHSLWDLPQCRVVWVAYAAAKCLSDRLYTAHDPDCGVQMHGTKV